MRRAVCVMLLAAACNRPANMKEKMNPTMPPQREVPSTRVTAATPLQARLELQEYEIRMPDALAAGRHSFTVVNSGTQNHSLIIDGNGLRTRLPQPLTRGDSSQLDVDLKPGTYTFYCPVDDHKGKGMTRTVTVQ